MDGYVDNIASWKYMKATKPLQLYKINGTKKGNIPSGTVFRVYAGKVGGPWSNDWIGAQTDDGIAVELPPRGPGQVWAAYEVDENHKEPPVSAQLADSSRFKRRLWAGYVDVTNNSIAAGTGSDQLGATVVDEFGDNVGQQGQGNIVYKIPGSTKPGKGWTPAVPTTPKTPTHPQGGGDKPIPKKGEDTNWLWWVLAAGSMAAGAPVAVPLGLVAVGVASMGDKKK